MTFDGGWRADLPPVFLHLGIATGLLSNSFFYRTLGYHGYEVVLQHCQALPCRQQQRRQFDRHLTYRRCAATSPAS